MVPASMLVPAQGAPALAPETPLLHCVATSLGQGLQGGAPRQPPALLVREAHYAGTRYCLNQITLPVSIARSN